MTCRRKGESQSFWQGFFDVFGIDLKRQGAFFEYRAKKIADKQGFMDVFWPGKILVEQKSLGKDLDAAIEQANNYLPNIEDELLSVIY